MLMLLRCLMIFIYRKNINCSISESLQQFEAVCEAARKNNIIPACKRVRFSLTNDCSFMCTANVSQYCLNL